MITKEFLTDFVNSNAQKKNIWIPETNVFTYQDIEASDGIRSGTIELIDKSILRGGKLNISIHTQIYEWANYNPIMFTIKYKLHNGKVFKQHVKQDIINLTGTNNRTIPDANESFQITLTSDNMMAVVFNIEFIGVFTSVEIDWLILADTTNATNVFNTYDSHFIGYKQIN